jgi:phosphatidylcholine synthase
LPPLARARARARACAFAIHVLTATGAALALGALIYAVRGQWAAMFVCLGIALIVDGVDGTLARAFRVAELLPRWSGDLLDLVVDFTTYVFVPAYAIATGGLLPEPLALPAGFLIVVTGALYFASLEMKTVDNYFRGFPALWNVAAFYLFLLKPAPWLASVIVVVLAVLTFLPFKFIHPVRVARLRALNIAALIAWSALALIAVLRGLEPEAWIAGGLVVIGLYFFAVGLIDQIGKHDRAAI